MHKDLGHCVTPGVDILYLLWCNVLSLGQLEDVLLPVHNSQSAVLYTKMRDRNKSVMKH